MARSRVSKTARRGAPPLKKQDSILTHEIWATCYPPPVRQILFQPRETWATRPDFFTNRIKAPEA